MDGRLIFLHHAWRSMRVRTLAGKASGPLDVGVPQGRGHLRSRSPRKDSQEKPVADEAGVPVLKLTQVGEMNILRRSRERS